MTTEATVVFVIVVGLRFLLPLFIPRFPLPAIFACLVLDGIDQTIFQTFGFDPPGYQNYDKAMDLFYLSIAFLSSLQNWTRSSAVGISRFLFFYRMVGVMAFEITGVRTLLLVFPNTFEYFFIAYEVVRLRWDPRRFSHALLAPHGGGDLDLRQAAPGVLDPRGPARLHRHLAERAVVRSARRRPRCSSVWPCSGSSCGPASCRPTGPGTWPPTRCPRRWTPPPSATRGPPRTCGSGRGRRWRRSCSSACCRRSTRASCPGLEVSDLRMFVGIAVFVVVNAAISIAFARRAGTREGLAGDFGVRVVVNLGLVLLARLLLGAGALDVSATLFFVLLLSLLVTMHDRFAPVARGAGRARPHRPGAGRPRHRLRPGAARQIWAVGELAEHLRRAPVERGTPEHDARRRAGRARRPCRPRA